MRTVLLAATLLVSARLAAQARDERTAAIGMRAHIEQVVLPGSELIAAPAPLGTLF